MLPRFFHANNELNIFIFNPFMQGGLSWRPAGLCDGSML